MDTAMRSIDPSLPPGASLCQGKSSRGTIGPLFWQAYKALFEFGYYVDHETRGRIHTSTCDLETAFKAEKAAAEFCRQWKDPPAETLEVEIFGGWLVTSCLTSDGWAAELTDPTGISTGPDWLKNYKTEAAALDGGRRWARANPATEHRFAVGHRVDLEGQPELAPAPPVVSDDQPLSVTVAGWDVLAIAGRPGTFKAELANASTGQRGATDKDFTGFPTPAAALKAGVAWATEHPCDPRLAALDEPRISAKVAGQVIDLEEVYGDADEPLGDEVPGTGWYVTTVDGKAGTFDGLLLAEGGEVCPERFSGHTTRDGAAAEACEWARANPTPICAAGGAELEGEVKADAFVCGWAITGEQSSSGKFEAVLVDVQTGEPGALEEDLGGFDSFDDAMREASSWARRHPTPSFVQVGDGEPVAVAVAAADPVVDALALGEVLRQQLALVTEQRDAALAGIAADMRKGGENAAEYRQLALQKNQNNYAIAQLKDSNKGIDVRMGELGIGLVDLVEGLATGTRGAAYQIGLTFDRSSAVKASVGAQAARAADSMSSLARETGMDIVWPFNGVDHVIETSHESTPVGERWTAWIRGHRDATESYHEDEVQAIEACKNAAAIYFENCDPGQIKPSADPAVKLKRGRKPKLGEHSIADVADAVACQPFLDAALALGVTPQKLQGFCEKNGIALAGKLSPSAPTEKAPRGRKAKAVQT